MKEAQAKDIRRLLGITTSRYDYLTTKLGIIPKDQQVHGRGKVQKYPFKYVLQFAVAERVSQFGLNPGQVRQILDSLDQLHAAEMCWPDDSYTREIISKRKDDYFSEDTMDDLYLIIIVGAFHIVEKDVDEERSRPIIHTETPSLYYFPNIASVSDFISKKTFSVKMLVDLAQIKKNVIDFLETGSTWMGW
jgi:hypothetical protein